MSSWNHLTEEEKVAQKQYDLELKSWEDSVAFIPKDSVSPEMTAAHRTLSSDELKELLTVPCRTKREVRNWVKLFLNQDLPDDTPNPDSTSNPLDMIWKLYRTAVFYDEIPESERYLNSVFYCSRGSFKSLAASVAALMVMLHSGRNVVYIGLIESQAKNAYQMYLRPFLEKPYISDWMKINTILERSEVRDNKGKPTTLQVIPMTMNKTSSPRANFVILDEVDKCKGEQVLAFENTYGMLTDTNDKKMAMLLAISSRDSAFGKIQDMIDNADKTGTKVEHWNRISITEKCPDTRSGTVPTKFYIKRDTLIAITEDQYEELDEGDKRNFDLEWGLDGCVGKKCKIFAACRGYLKNQKSKSKWLKGIDNTQKDLMSAPSEEMALSQLLCKLPPRRGLVYSDFDSTKNMKTPAEMYEVAFGKKPLNDRMKIEELIAAFQAAGFGFYIGVDAGFWHPACLLVAIDHDKENVFVLKEHMPEEVDSEELAQWLKENWLQYDVTKVYVDPESVDCTRAIRKAKFPVSAKVDKKRQPGISTVKGFIRRPATLTTQLFVNKDCLGFKYEISRWSYKTDSAGNYTDEAEKKNDHSMDVIRYILHSLYGKSRGNVDYASQKQISINDLKYEEAIKEINRHVLSPHYIAGLSGERVDDNRHILEDKDDTKPKKKSTTGFSFDDY